MSRDAALLEAVSALAREAGHLIMRYYDAGAAVWRKDDHSPVTEADHAANALIVEALLKLTPGVPVIAEESEHSHAPEALGNGAFWLVDPLDGTRSFIRRRGYFTVNIGLIEQRVPILGTIHVPTDDTLYGGLPGHAFRQAGAAGRETIRCRPLPAEGYTALVSHAHRDPKEMDFLEKLPVHETAQASSSLKFCRIAEGAADIYPRFGPTMEWDTAAGHAIVNAAGGSVTTLKNAAFLYAKPEFRNGAFVARGG